MNHHPVSDNDRRKLQAALGALLFFIYRKHYEAVLARLGAEPSLGFPSGSAHTRIDIFAAKRARLIQDGINKRIAAALAALPAGSTEADQEQTVREEVTKADDHHQKTLIPFLAAWAANQGQIDAEGIKDPATGKPYRDGHLWVWTQRTDYKDDCTAAAAASPAHFETLVSIAGGVPPVHENCQCDLEPA